MYAIVYKSDGVPICVQVDGVSPDPVVVWADEGSAKAFIDGRGGSDEFQPVPVTEQSMETLAVALGCAVEQITVEQYPA